MSRDRVQSIAFWEHTFDFRWGFAMVFESTTEPQREAQNDLSECTNLIATLDFTVVSEACTQKVL